MKVVLLLLSVAATAWADNCDNSFGAYLNALKDEIASDDSKSRALEEENRDDYHKLIRQCFAESSDDTSKCHLTDDEMNVDIYGDSGPLKGCERCQQMAKGLHNKYMKSEESVRICFRKHLRQAIGEELEPCIQGKISDYNFKIPLIPDFDEKTFKSIDIAEQGVNYRIWAKSRLDACHTVNPAGFESTNVCMANGYAGIFAKHCQAAKNAKAKAVTGTSCASRFDVVKTATCKCMDEKRNEWHDKFVKVQDIVNNAQSASQCGKDISDVLGAWLKKLQDALKECLPPNSDGHKMGDLHTLIELGCGQVISGGVKKNELTTGFRFIRLFLDALNDRVTMYCDKNCSF